MLNHHNLLPDTPLIPSILKACGGLHYLKPGHQLHALSILNGWCLHPFIASSLVLFYVKCGDIPFARKVFDEMREKDLVAGSALVSGYARKGCVKEAREVFGGIGSVNVVTWNGMVAGFNQSGRCLEAVEVFKEMCEVFKEMCEQVLKADRECVEQGLWVWVVSALIDMYGKCGSTVEMLRVFDEMGCKDVGACNALISGFARNGLTEEALEAFKRLRSQGLELNVVSWTSIIACCSQHGKDIEALELFREMQVCGVKPNSVTIPCLLPACGNIAALMHGKSAHGFSLRTGISNNVYVGTALIDMYANCGRIKLARVCFDKMSVRNIVCWNAIMGGYAMHGNASQVIEIFNLMEKSNQKPDFITFTSLLSACSHSGFTEQGERFFNKMTKDYGLKPRVEHYACLVTLLGRAGKLKEAYSTIEKMPCEPDACVWGALLSSCRVHNTMELAEVAADKLFELEPRNPGNYVLLSNIYANKGLWKEVDRVRDLMKSMGMRKNPGCSWIEIKNKVHMLLAGDRSHPQMIQIIEKMDHLSMEMKKAGCLPMTSFVLQDVEDQEKEHILCGHSEKLAVVLGLLNTPQGSTLQLETQIVFITSKKDCVRVGIIGDEIILVSIHMSKSTAVAMFGVNSEKLYTCGVREKFIIGRKPLALSEGRASIETTRHVSVISITLSTKELDTSSTGYQPTLPAGVAGEYALNDKNGSYMAPIIVDFLVKEFGHFPRRHVAGEYVVKF
ncbi:pentatricopeptide repeat-containing protein [Tanacetum coccineum]